MQGNSIVAINNAHRIFRRTRGQNIKRMYLQYGNKYARKLIDAYSYYIIDTRIYQCAYLV